MHTQIMSTPDINCHASIKSGGSSLQVRQFSWSIYTHLRWSIYSVFKEFTMQFKCFCTRYSRLFFTLSFMWYYSGFLPYKALRFHNVLRAQYPQLHTLLILSVIFIFSPSFYVELSTYVIAFWSIVMSHQHSNNILLYVLLYFKMIF